jgi:regulator of replication initiation timing
MKKSALLLSISLLYACSTPKPDFRHEKTVSGDTTHEKAQENEQENKQDKVHKTEIPEIENIGGCLESPDNCTNRWGIYLYKNGDCYEGYFKNGQKDGDGTLYLTNNTRIETFWQNDKKVGEIGRTFGKTMEEKYDPINLKRTCQDVMTCSTLIPSSEQVNKRFDIFQKLARMKIQLDIAQQEANSFKNQLAIAQEETHKTQKEANRLKAQLDIAQNELKQLRSQPARINVDEQVQNGALWKEYQPQPRIENKVSGKPAPDANKKWGGLLCHNDIATRTLKITFEFLGSLSVPINSIILNKASLLRDNKIILARKYDNIIYAKEECQKWIKMSQSYNGNREIVLNFFPQNSRIELSKPHLFIYLNYY